MSIRFGLSPQGDTNLSAPVVRGSQIARDFFHSKSNDDGSRHYAYAVLRARALEAFAVVLAAYAIWEVVAVFCRGLDSL